MTEYFVFFPSSITVVCKRLGARSASRRIPSPGYSKSPLFAGKQKGFRPTPPRERSFSEVSFSHALANASDRVFITAFNSLDVIFASNTGGVARSHFTFSKGLAEKFLISDFLLNLPNLAPLKSEKLKLVSVRLDKTKSQSFNSTNEKSTLERFALAKSALCNLA